MHQERLLKQTLLTKVKGKRPVGQPCTCWADYIEDLGWNRLGLQPSKMLEVVADLCPVLILLQDMFSHTRIKLFSFLHLSRKLLSSVFTKKTKQKLGKFYF